jgi:hypothetical protein
MAVNINSFKIFVEFIISKTQSGGTVTTAQNNVLFMRSQMAVYEKDRNTYLETGRSSDFLNIFLKTKTVTPNITTGYLSYPSDFQHIANVRSYYNKKEREVELVSNKMWGDINASQLMQPTKVFPKYSEYSSEMRFLPRDIGVVMLDYFKTPTQPIWGFTIVNNVQVYDATSSVDFEFDEFSVNRVAAEYLAFVGCNLQNIPVEQFAQEFKKESNVAL